MKLESRGAVFSPCRNWRYILWEKFIEAPERICVFVLLNPSSATEEINDPTVARCIERGRSLGFEQVTIVNLFAWRSTLPVVLKMVPNPVGVDNDEHIIRECKKAAMVICGWGMTQSIHKLIRKRQAEVLEYLRYHDIELHYLRMSRITGAPWHPLYINYSEGPKPWL